MARRSEHSQEQLKEMILVASEEIVREQGFSALKVRKIAADIGYTVGSIYMVFTNMDDLMIHIKVRTLRKLFQSLQDSILVISPKGGVLTMALAYIDFIMKNQGLWRMLFEHQLSVDAVIPEGYRQEWQAIDHCFYVPLLPYHSLASERQVQKIARVLAKSLQGLGMQLMWEIQSENVINEVQEEVGLLVSVLIREKV